MHLLRMLAPQMRDQLLPHCSRLVANSCAVPGRRDCDRVLPAYPPELNLVEYPGDTGSITSYPTAAQKFSATQRGLPSTLQSRPTPITAFGNTLLFSNNPATVCETP
jgi:hypothetical protein